MVTTLDVFISSKMQELEPERAALYEFLDTLDYGDIKLHAWLFERDAPATSRSVRETYLQALQNSALYIGIFWKELGDWTVDELDRATDAGMERHIYIKDVDAHERSAALQQLLERYGPVPTGITTKWFKTIDDLRKAVAQSIEAWIVQRLRARSEGPVAQLIGDSGDLLQLPKQLIGRDDVRVEVCRLLNRGDRVLLHGFGGVGKTALAAAAASDWLQSCTGPIVWLRAGTSGEDLVFQAIARVFDAAQTLQSSKGDDRIVLIRKLIRDARVSLVVLDDCWNGRTLFSILGALPSKVPVLATARQRYGVDTLIDVDGLSLESALELLLLHSKQRPELAARVLCKKLAFHPFSLEVAGKTLKAMGWSAQELLERIADTPHELAVPADFSERERGSVKELLDTSVRALDAQSRSAFLAFGAFFAPRLTVQMLAQYLHSVVVWGDEALTMPAIAGPREGQVALVRSLLDALEVHGLAQRVSSAKRQVFSIRFSSTGVVERQDEEVVEYYRIHDLAYSYVRAQSTADNHEKALDLCLAYTFFHPVPGPGTFASLRAEIDNLLGAATFALDSGRYYHVDRFAVNLSHQVNFFASEGAYAQEIRLYEQAVEAGMRRADPEAQSRNLANLGSAHLRSGQVDRSLPYLLEALELAQARGDSSVSLIVQLNLGTAYMQLGRGEMARSLLTKVLEDARAQRETRIACQAAGNLGVLHMDLEDAAMAQRYLVESVELSRNLHDPACLSYGLANLGALYHRAGRPNAAAAAYGESIDLARKLGDRPTEAKAGHGLGFVLRGAKDVAGAFRAWTAARDVFASLGQDEMVQECQELVASLRGICGACGAPCPEDTVFGILTSVPDTDSALLGRFFRKELDDAECAGCGTLLAAPSVVVSFDNHAQDWILFGAVARARPDDITAIVNSATDEGTIVKTFESLDSLRDAVWGRLSEGAARVWEAVASSLIRPESDSDWREVWPLLTSSAFAAVSVQKQALGLSIHLTMESAQILLAGSTDANDRALRQLQANVWCGMCHAWGEAEGRSQTLERDLEKYVAPGAIIAGSAELFFAYLATLNPEDMAVPVLYAFEATRATLHYFMGTANSAEPRWISLYQTVELMRTAPGGEGSELLKALCISEARARATLSNQVLRAARELQGEG